MARTVTPAQAGVQAECPTWIPAFVGMTEKGVFRLFTKPSMASHTKPKGCSSMPNDQYSILNVQCPMFNDQ
jgi:hypothetical protein